MKQTIVFEYADIISSSYRKSSKSSSKGPRFRRFSWHFYFWLKATNSISILFWNIFAQKWQILFLSCYWIFVRCLICHYLPFSFSLLEQIFLERIELQKSENLLSRLHANLSFVVILREITKVWSLNRRKISIFVFTLFINLATEIVLDIL